MTHPGRAVLALACALGLGGCAAPAALQPAAAPPVATQLPASPPESPVATGRDTTPSPEALAVLATIPEPVPAAAPASPAGSVRGAPRSMPVPPPEPDTLARAIESSLVAADTVVTADTSSVPVPVPTRPLGADEPRHLPAPALPESTATAAPPAAPAAVAPPTPSAPDTCWRVQVGAPAERARGRVLRDAAQSLLLVPMIVDHEAGRWKVRSRDCLPRPVAETLRDRAIASGFQGVFLVRFVEPR
jgi:hypothetical protein